MTLLKITPPKPSDLLVSLRLQDGIGGGVFVQAIDPYGNVISNLIYFKEDGTVYLCPNIDSRQLPFKLDSDNRIVISNGASG